MSTKSDHDIHENLRVRIDVCGNSASNNDGCVAELRAHFHCEWCNNDNKDGGYAYVELTRQQCEELVKVLQRRLEDPDDGYGFEGRK